MRPSVLVFSIVLVALAGGALAARKPILARRQARELERLVPGLEPDLARHVVADSDTEWFAYCRMVGTGALSNAFQSLRVALRWAPYPQFLERRGPDLEASRRIGEGFLRVYDFVEPIRVAEHDLRLTPAQLFDVFRIERQYCELAADTSLAPGERARRIDEIARVFREQGDAYRDVMVQLAAVPMELEAGHPDRHRARLETVLAMARRLDQHYIACQLLGDLGILHRNASHPDSMRACFDEGIATALRHGFLDHAARLLRFDAVALTKQGRLASALQRLAEAQRLCAGPGGESAQLRMHVEYTKFVANLGCWDLVDRSLHSVPPLIREFPRIGRPDAGKFTFDTDLLRARLAFATGQVDRAAAMMSRITVPAPSRRVGLAELFDEWSAGLAAADRPVAALVICERGLAHCDSTFVPEHATTLRVRRARLLTVLGRFAEATAALDQIDTMKVGVPADMAPLREQAAIARARLLRLQGHGERARRLIEHTFVAFRERLRHGNAGALSPLALADALELRDAMHEIEDFTPRDGYRFELEWRSLSGEIGARHSGVHGNARAVLTRPSPILERDATHLVFHFMNDALLRWTARGGRVTLDTLPLSALQSLEDVRTILDVLQSEEAPAASLLGPRALEELRPLSRLLLPAVDRTSSDAAPLYVSPDGPLVALPFETLLVTDGPGERPVAAVRDVAYLDGRERPNTSQRGRFVVVSNPALSDEVRRRHGWTTAPEAGAEIDAIRARWANVEVLAGDRATKPAVLASLPDAGMFYLAGHHVRDPDAPFLGYVPLAASGAAGPDANVMEIADIRQLDLTKCRLAVLASCASGAPYRLAREPGASLGDAFIDSGAGGVVQSFWDVTDSDTRTFMDAFLATWREDDSDVAALGRARRQVMHTATGASPRVWAAWSIKTRSAGSANVPVAGRSPASGTVGHAR